MPRQLHNQTKEIMQRRGWTAEKIGKYWSLLADFAEPVILTRRELDAWVYRRDCELG